MLVGLCVEVGTLVLEGIAVGQVEHRVKVGVGELQSCRVNLTFRPGGRLGELQEYCVKVVWSFCTPEVPLAPFCAICPYTRSNLLGAPSYKRTSKLAEPALPK